MGVRYCNRGESAPLHSYDALIIGAGFAGAIMARELAERTGKRVAIIEQRDHIGGNAYDRLDDAGVLIHQYGPHIFHTNNREVWDYVQQFAEFNRFTNSPVANYKGEL